MGYVASRVAGSSYGGVTKECKSLGEVDIFCGVVFVFCKQLSNSSAEPVAEAAEVSECKFVCLDDLFHCRCAVCGRCSGDESQEHAAADVERKSGKAADLAENCDHRCHVQCVVAGQEDVLKSGEAGQHDVEDHSQSHDVGCLCAKILKRVGYDRLVVGYDALHVEGVVENVSECKK